MVRVVLLAFAIASSAFAHRALEGLEDQSLLRLNVPASSVAALTTAFPDLDVWPDPPLRPGINDVRIQPLKGHTLEAIRRVAPEVALLGTQIDNIRTAAEENFKAHDRWVAMGSPTNTSWFQTYHTYAELTAWYRELATTYPDSVTYHRRVGTSLDGRELDVVHLHFGGSASWKPRVWLQGLIHAREWIAGAALNYVIDQLVEKHSSANPRGGGILDDIEVFVVPVLNPDGYQYTWDRDRMWRKNRRLVTGSTYGVDLNRNFDDHWGGDGSSGTPSSETYRGASAFSEPETQFVRDAMTQFRGGLGRGWTCAVDMHSYGQLILRPWGWTTSARLIDTPTEPQLKAIGEDIRQAMSEQRGCRNGDAACQWTNEHAGELYAAAGGSDDWFYSAAPLNGTTPMIEYTFEGRPPQSGSGSNYGFDWPAAQILPAAEEMLAGYLTFLGSCAGASKASQEIRKMSVRV